MVTLAFLAGILWGNAVIRPIPQKYLRIVVSNAVALIAALARLAGSYVTGALLFAAGHVGLLAYERTDADSHSWYISLRSGLTLGALPPHSVFILAMAR